jgi:hypothetical protein
VTGGFAWPGEAIAVSPVDEPVVGPVEGPVEEPVEEFTEGLGEVETDALSFPVTTRPRFDGMAVEYVRPKYPSEYAISKPER